MKGVIPVDRGEGCRDEDAAEPRVGKSSPFAYGDSYGFEDSASGVKYLIVGISEPVMASGSAE